MYTRDVSQQAEDGEHSAVATEHDEAEIECIDADDPGIHKYQSIDDDDIDSQPRTVIDRENSPQPTDKEKDAGLPIKTRRNASGLRNNPTYASGAQDEDIWCMVFSRCCLLRVVVITAAVAALIGSTCLTVMYLTVQPGNGTEIHQHLAASVYPPDPTTWNTSTMTLEDETTGPQDVTTTVSGMIYSLPETDARDTTPTFNQPVNCQDGDGASYRGTVSVTETGKICQRWDSQKPHSHDKTPANHPSSGLERNYCRNPDGEPGVWCYTTDPGQRWEYCDVQACETTFACWSKYLELSCPSGMTLLIDPVTYDRTSAPVCPCGACDPNCRTANSLSVMKGACEGLQQCIVRASGHVFGDPCHDTKNYAAAPTYRCVPVPPVTDDDLEVLVTKYAPKIWLAKKEKFYPSSVDFHLQNVKVYDGGKSYFSTSSTLPTCSETCYMSTRKSMRYPETWLPFFSGEQVGPTYQPPVYAVVKKIKPTTTDIFYWMFYPYQGPKSACLGYRPPWGGCIGGKRSFAHRVGNWERMTIRLVGGQQRSIYVYSAYKCEGIYDWDPASQTYRRGEDTVQTEGTHPVLYSAYGNHKLWPTPGSHRYKRILISEQLFDETSEGTAWDTWKNVPFTMYRPDGGYTGSWSWLNYQGRWGNRKSGCHIEKFRGECILSDGSTSINYRPEMKSDKLD